MLKLEIPDVELYNEEKNEFFTIPGCTLVLEHSLVSLSKWEAKWHKPFLAKDNKSRKEILDYVRCMTITQNVNDDIYKYMPSHILDRIGDYIEDPMTATTFAQNNSKNSVSREVITSEIIYFWMINFNIPMECQKWHLNRLLTLINVCNLKFQPKRKMTPQEIAARNRALNAERKAKYGTRG